MCILDASGNPAVVAAQRKYETVKARRADTAVPLNEILARIILLDDRIEARNREMARLREENLHDEDAREKLNTAARKSLRGQPDRAVTDGPDNTRWQVIDGRVSSVDRVDAEDLFATAELPWPLPGTEAAEFGPKSVAGIDGCGDGCAPNAETREAASC